MNVLITTDCAPDNRKALAVIRALAAQRATVFVAGDRFRGQAYWSRFLKWRFLLPNPAAGGQEYVEALLAIVRKAGIDVVVPMEIDTIRPLSQYRDRLTGHVRFVVPSEAALRIACDKRATLEIASREGVRIPKTASPSNAEELRAVGAGLSYPVVVKPVTGFGALGLWFAESQDQLIREWGQPRPGAPADPAWGGMLVQEYIPGPIQDACFLFRHGEPRAVLTQQRLLMYPASGGGGVLNETTDAPDLVDAGTRLLRRLAWHGPAQVEFKRDGRTNEPVLMEINGRLWGTLDLAVQAGVNIPWLICRLAMDGDIAVQTGFTMGLRYRWPLPYGLLNALETGQPLRSFFRFFAPARRTRSDLRWDDPLPLLAEAAYAIQRMRARRSWIPARGLKPSFTAGPASKASGR